jgi:hypothetical protein
MLTISSSALRSSLLSSTIQTEISFIMAKMGFPSFPAIPQTGISSTGYI